MVVTLLGIPSPFVAAAAATASGGEMMAPKTNDSGQPNSGMQKCAAIATIVVVNSTHPIASNEIARMLFLNSGKEVVHAAAYKTGGRKIRKTTSGFSDTIGSPGT